MSARFAAALMQQRVQSFAGHLALFAARLDLSEAVRTRDRTALDALVTQFASPSEFKLVGIVGPGDDVMAQAPSGLVDPSFAADVSAIAAEATRAHRGWTFMDPDVGGPTPGGYGDTAGFRSPMRPETVGVIVVPLEVGAERLAVYGTLSWTRFDSVFQPVVLPSGRSVVVLDSTGKLVAAADANGAGAVPIQPSYGCCRYTIEVPGLQQALSSEAGTLTTTIGGEERLATHVAVLPGHWVLYLLDSPAAALAGLRRLTTQVTLGAGIAAVVALTLATVLAILVGQLRRQRTELARMAISEERLRFARDLHDLLGRGLSLIAIKSELVMRLVPGNPAATKEVGEIEGVAREALRNVREAVDGYRQPRLATELASARSALAAAGIECHVEQRGGELPDPIDALFAWTVREGVTNVMRHSGAERCEIRVSRGERDAQVEVMDDGVAEAPGTAGYGLLGLKERAAARGGVAEAGPLPGAGFRLRIAVPVGPTG